ncbi:DEAD/DEAH box helicase [Paenibacillus prosopidis]|uniref:Competence protein ComFA n=1 Tax=Paenibacillus prosopidis TaxID=630520 RepID=A0A368VVV9_9BACL|nr:helicase-related protein [Paenibacillus prosopidis]RCW44823.1 competence protein ComFA [Paenibacillus prosopidis]
MKAHVYVVEVNGCWQARATIQPAVDELFWMNGSFGAAGSLNEAIAASGWLWREALPLGDAFRVVELWERGRMNGSGGKKGGEMSRQDGWDGKGGNNSGDDGWNAKGGINSWDDGWNDKSENNRDYEALERLNACVEGAKREAGDEAGAHIGDWWKRLGGWRKKDHVVKRGASLLGMAERWERAAYSGEQWGVELAISDAEIREIAAGAKLAAELMQGRALLRGEAHALLDGAGGPEATAGWSGALQLATLLGRVRLSGAVAAGEGGRADATWRRRRERRCLRCGSGEAHLRRTPCAACGRMCAYCSACIGMGRSRECELLVIGQRDSPLADHTSFIAPGHLSLEQRLAKWSLSPAQSAAAAKALHFVEQGPYELTPHSPAEKAEPIRNFLLWAVTGAGKTEMIFPLVESVLLKGGKALIATPRRDVVIELDPRIRKAFPQASVVTLYGGSTQRWESGDITLSTTHQLLRFYQGFDLVVLDEIDAFPYHGDPILHYAADKSCMPGAARLLLSATPPNELQRAARRGKLPHARVPVRYHRHPLPVPKLLRTPALKQILQQRKLPPQLLAAMRQSLLRDAQLFVFVQQIAQSAQMAALLRIVLGNPAVEATSSQDPERAEKVQRFRSREIRVLVTTTILERGVTIPRSDVYILDADGRLFDEASLVQMAGRAGRSAEDPNGIVYFCSPERSQSQVSAVRHIQTMNRIARKQGYLLPVGKGGTPDE